MPENNPYRIFVTHAWDIHDDYQRLFDYLGDATNFYYVNLSKPEQEPPSGGNRLDLEQAFARQMEKAEAVIALGGVYDLQPELVDLQIGVARKNGKAVIALYPFGSHKMPGSLEDNATEVVIWNERMIVDAIKKHGRGEEPDRFEVIEFDL